MVLFNDALDHLIRIHRKLRMDRGHVLLIGSSGNGKKCLSKLAAFTSGNIILSLVTKKCMVISVFESPKCTVEYYFSFSYYLIFFFYQYSFDTN